MQPTLISWREIKKKTIDDEATQNQ
jgi:hypothetical protein